MIRYLIILTLFILGFANDNNTVTSTSNIWLKTYKSYKNYNTLISNMTKIEEKLKNTKLSGEEKENLLKKQVINRSKLRLYEKNNNFDVILLKYKIELPSVSLLEFLLQNNLKNMDKTITKFQMDKNAFYQAKATLENEFNLLKEESIKSSKLKGLKSDIEFFEAYVETIESTYLNLYEQRHELLKRYNEYKSEVFVKHVFTLGVIALLFIIYKGISVFCRRLCTEEASYYNKLVSLLFVISVLVFLIMRYISDIVYIVTFLGVVAAALTIAMREVLLNFVGSIYIFFTSIIKVGDRVMVQFDTKHTVGDIISISLMKIKLQEVDDYNNIKEIKNVARTIYIPNSYIFTKVFYNYSAKKNGLISDMLEFEFDIENDFEYIETTISQLLDAKNITSKISFNLNAMKTAIVCIISYEVHFKQVTQKRGELIIELFAYLNNDKKIKLKSTKTPLKKKEEDEE